VGGSKKQTIGYKYFLGMHAILTHGPVDKLIRLQFDKKDAWVGSVDDGSFNVSAPGLFGGEDLGGQGGVSGAIDFMNGEETQGTNAYLVGQLGSRMPGFRGVTGLVFKHFYFGMSPYLKNFGARCQRIHRTTGGATQWYDEKAEVVLVSPKGGIYQFPGTSAHQTPGYNSSEATIELDDGESTMVSVLYGTAYSLWASDSEVTPGRKPWMCKLYVSKDGAAPATYVDGEYDTQAEAYQHARANPFILTGPGTFSIYLWDGDTQAFNNRGGLIFGVGVAGFGDMNPVHIIRECLTDGDWGMGYLAADVDDVSFKAAADTLYNEGLGMSLLWDKTKSIEDFIKDVCRHINATLYVSRTTGKFVLKLIRNDYVLDDLLELHPDDIDKVENYACKTTEELVNSVTVQYWDSATNTDASVTENDTALIQQLGSVINTTAQYPGFTNKDVATRIALRDLVSLSTPLISCVITVNQVAKNLNIGDAFKLFWPEFGTGYVVMRVAQMSLGNGRQNRIILTVTQDQFALPAQGTIAPPDPVWVDPQGPPAAATQRMVVEAPYYELIQRDTQVNVDALLADNPEAGMIVASAEKPTAGSVNADMQTDAGAGYALAATTDFSPAAYLTATLPRELGPSTVSVTPGRDFALMEAGGHIQVGNELCKINAVDIDAQTITLGRGVLDTVPDEHAAGDLLLAWDAFAGIDPTTYQLGESVDVKLQVRSGSGLLDLAAATADTVTLAGRAALPYPPGLVKIGGTAYPSTVSGTFTVTWAHRNRVTQADSLIDTTAASVTPAPNTRYGLRFLDDTDTLLVERQDIGPGTASVVLNYTGDVTMELYTIDNTGVSLQRHRFTFAYTPPGGTVVSAITATSYTPVDDTTIIDGGP